MNPEESPKETEINGVIALLNEHFVKDRRKRSRRQSQDQSSYMEKVTNSNHSDDPPSLSLLQHMKDFEHLLLDIHDAMAKIKRCGRTHHFLHLRRAENDLACINSRLDATAQAFTIGSLACVEIVAKNIQGTVEKVQAELSTISLALDKSNTLYCVTSPARQGRVGLNSWLGLCTVPSTGTAVVSTVRRRANPSRLRPIVEIQRLSTEWDGRWDGRHGRLGGDGFFRSQLRTSVRGPVECCFGKIPPLQLDITVVVAWALVCLGSEGVESLQNALVQKPYFKHRFPAHPHYNI
ncbi:hypothetical protein B0H10DRAFT_1967357 [Mycena sp. CBHHK59/15]|nr:hypothetical protein B0H10DRAFT_1967357 [Mycena sp. CBHHK59/15]